MDHMEVLVKKILDGDTRLGLAINTKWPKRILESIMWEVRHQFLFEILWKKNYRNRYYWFRLNENVILSLAAMTFMISSMPVSVKF